MKQAILKPGREKSLLRRHPWVFSGAIQQAPARAQAGETIRVVSADGQFLAWGAHSPSSQIRVRIWTFDPREQVDSCFFRIRLERAISLRRQLLGSGMTTLRLVNAESDGLPGLVVDKYGGFLVCQFLAAGAEFFKREIIDQLTVLLQPEGIYERSEAEARKKEGLEAVAGLLYGAEPPEYLEVEQDGTKCLVDIRRGHKTGMYLDQRENRLVVERYARDREVLNGFAYTGMFALAALRGGARSVTNVESSAEALALIHRNSACNSLDANRLMNVQGDVFQVMRGYRDWGTKFDMVILDPPKFVHAEQQLQSGCRGYKDINLLAIKLLNAGGLLITFSCSGHVGPDLFRKIIADAAVDAGRTARVIAALEQPCDHPVALNFPEGRYLKGLVCHVE